MKLSVFHGMESNETDRVDEEKDLPFESLKDVILKYAWAPGTFKETTWERRGKATTGRRRVKSGLQEISLLALDVDGGLTLPDAVETIKREGYRALIATTRSHQQVKAKPSGMVEPACDRFRIILPLERPLHTDEDYKATWHHAKALLPAIDSSCSDASRYFRPCQSIFFQQEGKPFPVAMAGAREVRAVREVSDELKGELAKATLKFISQGAHPGHWHHAFYKAAIDLKQNNYTFDEAEEMLTKATGFLDDTHDLPTLTDIYLNREPKHPPRIEATSPAEDSPPAYRRLSPEERLRIAESERSLRAFAQKNSIPFICKAFDDVFRLEMGLCLIGACTGQGKSTTAANILAHFFIQPDSTREALVISNEEDSESIYSRVACAILKQNWHHYKAETLEQEKLRTVRRFIAELTKRIEVVDGRIWDMTRLEDVQGVLDSAARAQENVGLVIVDYLQTVVTSKEHPEWTPIDVSKRLGLFLKDYGRRAPVPVVVFGQLRPKSEAQDFSSRFQNDRTIANHANVVIEVEPNFETKLTQFVFHKARNFELPRPVTVRWEGGRFEPLNAHSINSKALRGLK